MTKKPLIEFIRRHNFPIALFILCVISFIPTIYKLGFYWDDWPSIWFYHMWGPLSFKEGFAIDRPLLAYVFMLTTSILGESTLAWQTFGIFTRYLTSLALWWTLVGLWPNNRSQVKWIVILFTVYPGFSQQYISVTYSNAFLVFAMFIFSLGSMIYAIRKPKYFWVLMAASLVSSGLTMFISEYFFGLELFRPVILWILFNESRPQLSQKPNLEEVSTRMETGASLKKKLRRVIRYWFPYLGIMGLFLIWRIFLYQTARGKITLFNKINEDPGAALVNLLRTIFIDFIEVHIISWLRPLDPSTITDFDTGVIIYFIAIVLTGFSLTFLYLWKIKDTNDENEASSRKKWSIQATLIGIYLFLIAGWPIWVTDLHIELLFPWDRFTIPIMMGVSITISGLISFLTRKSWISALIVGILVGLATGMQFQQRLIYRQEWLSQKNFFWQMTWRAPGIQPGTMILTSEIPFTYYSDNSLTAPLNWLYNPDNTSKEMDFLLHDIEARDQIDTEEGKDLIELQPGQPMKVKYRAATFDGSTSQALVLFYDPPRCLKVIDPSIDRYLPVKPLYIREATNLSKPQLIQSEVENPASPPSHIFGPEPVHGWCYYFEKAEYYSQIGDWQKVAEMADKALKLNRHFTEKTIAEVIPFIRGYAMTGRWDKATELTIKAFQTWDKMEYILCDVWSNIADSTSEDERSSAALERIRNEIGCGFTE